MNIFKKIVKIINIAVILVILYYFRLLLIENTFKLNEFSQKQETYENKMDSLKLISEELVKNITLMDSKIVSSKKAIDDLKKKPIIITYTNEEALQFLRLFSAKYNLLFMDSVKTNE